MSSYKCPFCSQVMSVTSSTLKTHKICFRGVISPGDYDSTNINTDLLIVSFYKCPHCNEVSIILKGLGEKVNDILLPVYPRSLALQFPDYIPKAIKEDYEEACSVVSLSPKASATLSRRCLQGMIRDFWGISKPRLIDEINALKDNVPYTQWKVIDGIRRIGNIGAHMEKDIDLIVDIDPDEATKLIKLIEHLIKSWYIERHEQEILYSDIIEIDEDKQSLRKSKE